MSSSPFSSGARPDRAVLDDGQRLPEDGFLHAPERATVADDEHASVGMARCDFAEGARDSLGVVLVRLAVPRAPVDLRFRQPLPRADVDLAQPGLSLDGEAEARAYDLGRLRGAA